jgi:hypothetical protein
LRCIEGLQSRNFPTQRVAWDAEEEAIGQGRKVGEVDRSTRRKDNEL